ncbi:hypothetical protein EV182_004305 [Spiromyces aspiralis]|uniref:Uncharacterized protein n=1 Tax=Spiromyces aspiralis TaxID=68401 RepID=A0ACC1HQ26_9FUNG|nr:hypothetical protein EV182_004305 [Spiromyces aspiralis]
MLFGRDHMDVSYPMFVSSVHMVIQFLLSFILLYFIPRLRPPSRPSAKNYLTRVVPCGIASGLDIGMSNVSLQTITLTFYTMCKSSVPAFVLLFAIMFGVERFRWKLVGIIGIVSFGVLLMAASETEFVLSGFLQVMFAATMSGLRWSLTQILLVKAKFGMNNPLATILFLAPIMFVIMFTLSIAFEGPWQMLSVVESKGHIGLLRLTGMMAAGGVLAFVMVLSEFGIISRTSAVTLSIAGIFKEVLTVIFSVMTFQDKLNYVNVVGLGVALTGIILYNMYKLRLMSTAAVSASQPRPVTESYHASDRVGRSDSFSNQTMMGEMPTAVDEGRSRDSVPYVRAERRHEPSPSMPSSPLTKPQPKAARLVTVDSKLGKSAEF